MDSKKIVIVGGGTAGWLSALFLRKNLPDFFEISLIESDTIGILGAGEGSVPAFVDFLHELDIPFTELIKHTDATLKNGIKFTNWNKDKSSYFHNFFDSISPFHFNDYLNQNLLLLKNNGEKLDKIMLSSILSNFNKVKYRWNNSSTNNYDKMLLLDCLGTHSLHFNAVKIAFYLRHVGIQRGIKHSYGIVENLEVDQNNFIKKLYVAKEEGIGDFIDCDFVVDCSGFRRFFIGNYFKSSWRSYSKYLSVNKAIPFFLDMDQNDPIPPFTESIAMKHGWMWKIPLQSRYGCGYVFDSNIVSPDQAHNELQQFLGFEVDCPKAFSFEAGNYEKSWINNCVSIGLSNGFIEPLEATSIWSTIMSLKKLASSFDGILYKDEKSIQNFNKYVNDVNRDIFEFVLLHYLTDREDSEFWLKFKSIDLPDNLLKLLGLCEESFPTKYNYNLNSNFDFESWFQISNGIKKLNGNYNDRLSLFNNNNISDLLEKNYLMSLNTEGFLSHRNFLEFVCK